MSLSSMKRPTVRVRTMQHVCTQMRSFACQGTQAPHEACNILWVTQGQPHSHGVNQTLRFGGRSRGTRLRYQSPLHVLKWTTERPVFLKDSHLVFAPFFVLSPQIFHFFYPLSHVVMYKNFDYEILRLNEIVEAM